MNIRQTDAPKEQGEMFPRFRKTGVDLVALGEVMSTRKEQLKTNSARSDPINLIKLNKHEYVSSPCCGCKGLHKKTIRVLVVLHGACFGFY